MYNFQNIKNITLSPEKKDNMWSIIAHQIELFENSSEKNVRTKAFVRPTFWGADALLPLPSKKKRMHSTKIFLSMILILWSIMGTSFAAERAIPGDTLYPFKVHINESLQGALHIGTEQNAKWEIQKIERRNQEKAQLEATARMTAERNAQIASESETSTENAKNSIAVLRNRWEVSVAASLEASLNAALNVSDKDADNTSIAQAESSQNTNIRHASSQSARLETMVKAPLNGAVSGSTKNSDTDNGSRDHTDGSINAAITSALSLNTDTATSSSSNGNIWSSTSWTSEAENSGSTSWNTSSHTSETSLNTTIDTATHNTQPDQSQSNSSASSWASDGSTNSSSSVDAGVDATVKSSADTISNLHL